MFLYIPLEINLHFERKCFLPNLLREIDVAFSDV
nr:MAG TPA: hypothetical protein [Caudoviricetes sp.]DAU09950.1 MAG TPA: hypothetical protein [Caudoviricetes sp.]